MNLVQEVMDYVKQCDPEVGEGLEKRCSDKGEIWN